MGEPFAQGRDMGLHLMWTGDVWAWWSMCGQLMVGAWWLAQFSISTSRLFHFDRSFQLGARWGLATECLVMARALSCLNHESRAMCQHKRLSDDKLSCSHRNGKALKNNAQELYVIV
jgi:hypothetical protein